MEVATSPQTPGSALSTQSSMDSCLSSPPPSTPNSRSQSKSSTKGKKSKSKMPYFWSGDDVIKWLRKHCGQYHEIYASNFRENDITGRSLVRLTDSKLERMGIVSPEHREDLMRQILKLKLRTEAQELKSLDQKGMSFER